MSTLEQYRNPNFVSFCDKELQEFVTSYKGTDLVLLATPDGFTITSSPGNIDNSADKLSAVGSSLFALASSLLDEFNLKNCKSTILDSDNGKVLISSINSMNDSIILMVQTNDKATLGNVMYGAKRLSRNISDKLGNLTR